jgi:hypothetical protein
MMIDSALDYARKSWQIFPVHNVNPEQKLCSCGNPDCDHPGKHPMTVEGFKEATTDVTKIKEWWDRWENANIGIKTGRACGIFVLDVDKNHDGFKSLTDLEKKYGKLPDTLIARTGGEGIHMYFAYPFNGESIPCSISKIGKGIDVKGDGGYVVAPPSIHVSGRRYEFLNAATIPQNAPDWLLLLIFGQKLKHAFEKLPDEIPTGKRNEVLFKLASSLRAKGLSEITLLDALKKENELRCKPPLSDQEIQNIANSAIGKYPSGNITQVHPATLEEMPFDKGDVEKEAMRVMQEEDVFEYFLKEYRKRHTGDEVVMRAVLSVVACSQIIHSFGLHPKMSGDMGSGKSSSIMEATRLIAPEFIMASAFSAKALFYTTISPGTIIISDDTMPDELTSETIKRKISEYHRETKHTVILDKKQGAVTLTIPPEVTFILTSVSDSVDEQLTDRQWIISVDKNPTTDKNYADYLLESAKTGFENYRETIETFICREITRRIKKNKYRVHIPFATEIQFGDSATKNRRALNIFVDLICCSAVINQEKRHVEVDGSIIVVTATNDDFHTALSLMGFGEGEWRYKLNKTEMMIFDAIASSPGGITQKDLVEKFKLSKGRISQILRGSGNNSNGLEYKAPINMTEVYDRESGIKSNVWKATGQINKMDGFAHLEM